MAWAATGRRRSFWRRKPRLLSDAKPIHLHWEVLSLHLPDIYNPPWRVGTRCQFLSILRDRHKSDNAAWQWSYRSNSSLVTEHSVRTLPFLSITSLFLFSISVSTSQSLSVAHTLTHTPYHLYLLLWWNLKNSRPRFLMLILWFSLSDWAHNACFAQVGILI